MSSPDSRFRIVWLAAGLLAAALGFCGVFLPVLPSTPFFLLAAGALARSSPRLHAWLLGLPHVGSTIKDYEQGLGIPRKTKILATALIVFTIGFSVTLGVEHWALRLGVTLLAGYGTFFIWRRVPTREEVLRETPPRPDRP